MKRSHRIQEWFADRVSWVQYPNLRPADAVTREASRSGYTFKYKMPLISRILLALSGLAMLIFSIGMLALLLVFVYCLLATPSA